jgi:hypothetical protein
LKGGKQTYALLDEWVPKTKSLPKEEALAKLAARYFSGHGPATLPDFIWWSGLPVNSARQALESVKRDFHSEIIDSQTYWFSGALSAANPAKEAAYLLPAFDEFIISYKDRRASLPHENHHKAVSNNGIFHPIIIVNGQVTGVWKRTIKKGGAGAPVSGSNPLTGTAERDPQAKPGAPTAAVQMTFFERPNRSTKILIDEAAEQYVRFIK